MVREDDESPSPHDRAENSRGRFRMPAYEAAADRAATWRGVEAISMDRVLHLIRWAPAPQWPPGCFLVPGGVAAALEKNIASNFDVSGMSSISDRVFRFRLGFERAMLSGAVVSWCIAPIAGIEHNSDSGEQPSDMSGDASASALPACGGHGLQSEDAAGTAGTASPQTAPRKAIDSLEGD